MEAVGPASIWSEPGVGNTVQRAHVHKPETDKYPGWPAWCEIT